MALYKGATKLAGVGVSNGIVTSATAPVSPVEGMVWYDTTNDVLKSYDGTNWNDTGKTYTAGTGISIDSNNVISNTQTSAEWGNITGTLADQTDLNTALSGKQDTLVSGTSIKTINSSSVLGSGDISIPDNVKQFNFPSVGDNIYEIQQWASSGHTAILRKSAYSDYNYYVVNRVTSETVSSGGQLVVEEVLYASKVIGNTITSVRIAAQSNIPSMLVTSITENSINAMVMDEDSPLSFSKFWLGEEQDYNNLESYSENTAYLTI